jgi:hypothetical protein
VVRLSVVVAALACVLACSVGASHAAAPSGVLLSRVVLRAAQVGPGYRLQQRADSQCVQGCVTLDLCGFTFATEKLRTGRLQVNYAHAGHAVQLSNEVVSYQPGGANESIRELDEAIDTCPHTPVGSKVQGLGPLTYRITRLKDTRLLVGYVALRIHIDGAANGKHIVGTTVAVYQDRGNVLSGLYTELAPDSTGAAQVRTALHCAEAAARNLEQFVK